MTTNSIEYLLPGSYELTITDTNDCEYFYDFIIGHTVSTSALTELAFKVFPNPTKDFIIVQSPKFSKQEIYWKLINKLGQEIQKKKILSNVYQTIELKNITSGIYFYEIVENDKIITIGKLIVL